MSRVNVKLVIAGHVDHGKSTLIGRLLLDTGSLPVEKIAEIKKISRDFGKESELAFATDQLREERDQERTIDTTQVFFRTRKRDFTVIDTPGHVEFLKNMITGATQADAAVLLVDASEGFKEQTERHAYIIGMIGLDKVIVVINKMDLVRYDVSRFNALKEEAIRILKNLKIACPIVVPVSAKYGSNVYKKDRRNMGWYKGSTLLQALDAIKPDSDMSDKPLRFPVQDVYEIGGENIVVGRIESGALSERQKVLALPSNKEVRINSLKAFGRRNKRRSEAKESVGLILDGGASVKRGDVLVQKDDPPQPTTRFIGNIFWLSNEPLIVGRLMTLRCATQDVKCAAERIEERIYPATLKPVKGDMSLLGPNEAGRVAFKTEEPLIAEKFSFIEELGRFVLERGNNLVGVGIIIG